MALAVAPFRLGPYRLTERIARGGMASVYVGYRGGGDTAERRYAVKVIHPHLSDDSQIQSMFMDELKIASRIQHPNVCELIDFGSDDEGTPYLVMEYLDGVTLAELQARRVDRKLNAPIATYIAREAALGLDAAHRATDEAGSPLAVVHRDVSPQNLMVLRNGLVKVLDFGIARARGRTSMTRSGQVKGKVAYMSPEQLRGEDVDASTDLWALGVVLWQMLVGYHPFAGQNVGEIVANVLSAPIRSPAEFIADCPAQLAKITMTALSRDRERRYQTGAELAEELDRFNIASARPWDCRQMADFVSEALALSLEPTGENTQPERGSRVVSAKSALLFRETPPDPEEEALQELWATSNQADQIGEDADTTTPPRSSASTPELATTGASRRPWAFALLVAGALAAAIALALLLSHFGK